MSKKTKDLIALTKEALEAKIKESRKELMKLNAQTATGTTVKNSGNIKQLRKMVARIKTILKQKEAAK